MLKYYKIPEGIVAGVDEAGRGCLAGPVVAAAVMLPENHAITIIQDSKQLSRQKREDAYDALQQLNCPIGVGIVPPNIIDNINILQATYQAMHVAITNLEIQPAALLIDGNRFKPYPGIVHSCIVKGDATYSAIAAASIIAKVTRDRYMRKQHELYPVYDWCNNKGYPTKKHREAIKKFGYSPEHRLSFAVK